MKDSKKQIFVVAGIACFVISGMASGAAMGFAQISQCPPGSLGGLSGVIVGGTQITWNPPTLGGTAGCFVTGSPTSITSTQPTITSGLWANILNLTAGVGSVNDFLTFPGTNLDFVLNGFGATFTTSTACDTTIGHSCIVVAGSPFELKNTSGGVDVDLTMQGTILDGGVTSNWTGLFTTQLSMVGVRETAFDVQNTILGGGYISSTYSATLNVNPVPEPGTVSMLLLAGGVLIGIGRKWRPHYACR